MNFLKATDEHFKYIGALGQAEVRNGRRYLCVVVSINNTTFQQTRKYEFLPAPDITLAHAAQGEMIMDLEPVLHFGPEFT